MPSRRAQQAAIAQRLRTEGGAGEGLTIPAIAREMGISTQYASELLSDPTGEKARARKRKYLKRCVVCGELCWGARCLEHSNKKLGKARRKWTPEIIIEAIQEWEVIHGRPPYSNEWSRRVGLPEWAPTTRVVYSRFGKNGWNKAIEAAGFTPRPAHGPDYSVASAGRNTKPMGSEARERLSEERKALYAEEPENPMFAGLRKGHELAKQDGIHGDLARSARRGKS